MAEIPVEKKSNLSWLWWLLLLAGIIALLWAIFDNDDDTPDVLEEDTAIVANDAATDVETVDPTCSARFGIPSSVCFDCSHPSIFETAS